MNRSELLLFLRQVRDYFEVLSTEELPEYLLKQLEEAISDLQEGGYD